MRTDILVQRVLNGQLDTRYEERLPDDFELSVNQGEDHVHVIVGTADDLKGLQLKPGFNDERKPKRKPSARKKSSAKKPAAKKSSAKKSSARKKSSAKKSSAKK